MYRLRANPKDNNVCGETQVLVPFCPFEWGGREKELIRTPVLDSRHEGVSLLMPNSQDSFQGKVLIHTEIFLKLRT